MLETNEPSGCLTPDVLNELVRRLRDALAPSAIYLFASYVCSRPTADSDIDLLVVVGDEVTSTWELRKRGYVCLHGLGLPVELHFIKAGQLSRFGQVVGSLQREVLEKGRLLYAA